MLFADFSSFEASQNWTTICDVVKEKEEMSEIALSFHSPSNM